MSKEKKKSMWWSTERMIALKDGGNVCCACMCQRKILQKGKMYLKLDHWRRGGENSICRKPDNLKQFVIIFFKTELLPLVLKHIKCFLCYKVCILM